MTAAAAAVSGAEADVPPVRLTSTVSGAPPKEWEKPSTLSDGAETFTREPYPLLKSVKPFQRTSGKACCAARLAFAGSCGGAELMSSSVVPPTSIEPLSKSRDGAPEKATSFRSLGLPPGPTASVAALPPEGATAALVNV